MTEPGAREIEAAGLDRAASLFPEDVAVAFRAAMTSRALLPPSPPPELPPWTPPAEPAP